MTQLRLGELALGHVLVAQLNGVVAVLLLGLLLHDGAGARLDDGDRDHVARFIEDLRHADLLADDGLFHVSSSLIKVIGRGFRRDLTRLSQTATGCGTTKLDGTSC